MLHFVISFHPLIPRIFLTKFDIFQLSVIEKRIALFEGKNFIAQRISNFTVGLTVDMPIQYMAIIIVTPRKMTKQCLLTKTAKQL